MLAGVSLSIEGTEMPKTKSQAHKKLCQAYRERGQREKNKKVKLLKHVAKFPNDLIARGHKLLTK